MYLVVQLMILISVDLYFARRYMRLIFIALTGFLVSCSGCQFETEIDLPFAAEAGAKAAIELSNMVETKWTN
jgi:hypothetical protein